MKKAEYSKSYGWMTQAEFIEIMNAPCDAQRIYLEQKIKRRAAARKYRDSRKST